MKLRLAVVALLAMPAVLAAQASAVGNWRAVFVGPIGPRPNMVGSVLFSVTAGPNGLTGTAKTMPEWPGDLDVTGITLDGNHLTFIGTGRDGWSVNRQYHCCPRLVFDGTIKGDQMTLTMTWTSTEAPNDPTAAVLPMEATRLPTGASPERFGFDCLAGSPVGVSRH
jgi:hypothetical protein